MKSLTNPEKTCNKYISEKEKKINKSARISFRTEPKNRKEFLLRVEKLGCSQDSLFARMLWNANNSGWQKIPPTVFMPIDDAINEISKLGNDPEIQKNVSVLRTNIRNLKSTYGWGYTR